MIKFISGAHPDHGTSQTRNLLEEISRSCATCQYISPLPCSFTVTLSDTIVFNHIVSLDLVYPEGNKPVLHNVDNKTNFSAITFLINFTMENILDTFIFCWASISGYLDNFMAHQGSEFTSKEFIYYCNFNGMELDLSDVEGHNSTGAGENLRSPLRLIYNKIRLEHS